MPAKKAKATWPRTRPSSPDLPPERGPRPLPRRAPRTPARSPDRRGTPRRVPTPSPPRVIPPGRINIPRGLPIRLPFPLNIPDPTSIIYPPTPQRPADILAPYATLKCTATPYTDPGAGYPADSHFGYRSGLVNAGDCALPLQAWTGAQPLTAVQPPQVTPAGNFTGVILQGKVNGPLGDPTGRVMQAGDRARYAAVWHFSVPEAINIPDPFLHWIPWSGTPLTFEDPNWTRRLPAYPPISPSQRPGRTAEPSGPRREPPQVRRNRRLLRIGFDLYGWGTPERDPTEGPDADDDQDYAGMHPGDWLGLGTPPVGTMPAISIGTGTGITPGRGTKTETQMETVTKRPVPNAGRTRPGAGTRERKFISRSQRVLIGIFTLLDYTSEGADIVNAVFEALPKAVRKRWKCDRNNPFLDTAGQYGISNADCKLQAIWHNYHHLDMDEAIRNIIINQIEDAIYGGIHAKLPKQTGAALDDSFKQLAEALKWLKEEMGLTG